MSQEITMKNTCRIIRVDPVNRTIVEMVPRFGKNASPKLQAIARAKRLGSRDLHDVRGTTLVVAGALDVEEDMKGWRLRGGEDTAGIGVLFGRIANDGAGMVDVPVSAKWIRERIQWLDGEDLGDRTARAEEMLPSLNDEVRAAISQAFVMPGGEMWLPIEHKAIVGEAMMTLGLATDRSEGQMLTKLGETVHDMLAAAEERTA